MVKILQPAVYTSWVRRKLVEPRTLPRRIEIGNVYLFFYNAGNSFEFNLAPIVIPLRIMNRGFYGVNLLLIPRRDLRLKFISMFDKINDIQSLKRRELEMYKLYTRLKAHSLYKNALIFYEYKEIKSRVVMVDRDSIDNLIRRVL